MDLNLTNKNHLLLNYNYIEPSINFFTKRFQYLSKQRELGTVKSIKLNNYQRDFSTNQLTLNSSSPSPSQRAARMVRRAIDGEGGA